MCIRDRFTTNGEGWQHIGEWKKFTRPSTSVTYSPQDTENLFGPNPKFNNTNLNQLRRSTEVGPEKKPVAWKYFGNPDQVTGGLGTGISVSYTHLLKKSRESL